MKEIRNLSKKQIISLLLIFAMLLNIIPVGLINEVFAAEPDTRTKVSSVTATSNIKDTIKYGCDAKIMPTFTVDGGKVYFATISGEWQKKNGSAWDTYKGVIKEGTYRYRTQIRIDENGGTDGTAYVLDTAGVTTVVDGVKWTTDSKIVTDDDYSFTWVTSPEYNVDVIAGLPLTFNKNDKWDIGLNHKDKAITPFSVVNEVFGGTMPYTFSKVSGPNWLNVSSDGTVSGTPTAIGTNNDLVIRVTDSASNKKEVTISVSETKMNPNSRTKVNNVTATSNIKDTVKYGCDAKIMPTFTVDGGKVYFATTSGEWQKKNGSAWDIYKGVFTEGTYRYRTQIRIDKNGGTDGTAYVLDTAGVTTVVDGVKWTTDSKIVTDDAYSFTWVTSPEYNVEKITYYTVKFNTNGGTQVENQIIEEGKKATRPETPTKDGYTFKGWYANNALNIPFNFETTAITSDTTIYAKFDRTIYTATFNTDGGTPVPKTQSIESGNKVIKPSEPIKKYHTFAGWYADEECKTLFNFDSIIKSNVKIYAKWTKDAPLVFTDDEDFDIGTTILNTTISSFNVKNNVSGGKTPYTFAKYSGPSWLQVSSNGNISGTATSVGPGGTLVVKVTDAECTSKMISINVGKTTRAIDDKIEISNVIVTSNMARPNIGVNVTNNYTFKFQGVQGTLLTNNVGAVWYKYNGTSWSKYEGTTFEAGTYKFRTQLRLDGDAAYRHKFANDVTLTVDGIEWTKTGRVYNELTYSSVQVESGEFVVAADGATKRYVTFNTMGGSNVPQQEVDINGYATSPRNLEKVGHTFIGWYEDEEYSSSEFEFSTTQITTDITLYAKWEEKALDPSVLVPTGSLADKEFVSKQVGQTYSDPDGAILMTITSNGNKLDTGYFKVEFEGANPESFYSPTGTSMEFPDETGTWTNGLLILPVPGLEAGTYTATAILMIDADYDGFHETEFGRTNLSVTILPSTETYTLTYNANGGAGTMEAKTGLTGQYTLPTTATFTAPTGKEFIGWSETIYCETLITSVEMSENKTVYAIWKDIPQYTVTFKDGDSVLKVETVTEGTKVEEPTAPTKTGYTFVRWCADLPTKIPFDFNTPINADTEIFAKFTENTPTTYSYTVNYLEKDTNEVLKTAKTENDITEGTKITAANEKIDIDGYNYNSANKTEITISSTEANNVLNLYYTKRNDLRYTVAYCDKDTDEVIKTAKVVNNQLFGTKIKAIDEKIDIDGYDYDSANREELIVTTTPEDNGLILYYTKKATTPPTYEFINNSGNQTFTVGKIDNYVIKITAPFDEFSGLKVNGVRFVINSDYKVTPGSTIITFLPAGINKLNDLSVGEYNVEIAMGNNNLTAKLNLIADNTSTDNENDQNNENTNVNNNTNNDSQINNDNSKKDTDTTTSNNNEKVDVKEDKITNNPKTSDTGITRYVITFIIATLGIVTIKFLRRKK